MNQLNGKYVNVVLTVEEGRGMEFIKAPITIQANFNGRVLESDEAAPGDSPSFNTELVWEIEKRDLRKVRSSNQPLRLECFTRNNQNRRDRVGFVLLSLRSAKIVLPGDTASLSWHKFIGTMNKKGCQPELALSLTIQEHIIRPAVAQEENVTVMPYITEEDTESDVEQPSTIECPEIDIPVKYLEDGYIRIGHANETNESFKLNLLVKMSANLDLLLPEVLVFGQTRNKYYLCFKIFGIVIKTKPFNEKLQETIELNEKIVVKLLSNKKTLETYFQNQKIVITFCCGIEKLGVTTIDLDKLQICDDEILECEETCFFKFPSPNGIIPCNGLLKPHIDVATCLERNQSVSELPFGDNTVTEVQSNRSLLTNIEKADGDKELNISKKNKVVRLPKVDQKLTADRAIKSKSELSVLMESKECILTNCPLQQPKEIKLSNTLSPYKKYCLEVAIKNFKLENSVGDVKCTFRVLHPKAASYLLNVNPKDESFSKFRIYYVAVDQQIGSLLKYWPPKIGLTDKKEQSLTETHIIQTHLFTKLQKSDGTLFEEDPWLLQNYKAILYEVNNSKSVASADVVMTLTESGLESQEDKNCLDLLPAVIDEEITIIEIVDLEKWKTEEKSMFQQKLKEIGNDETSKIKIEMKMKKKELEENVKKQMDKCKELQKELQEKVNSFKTEKMLKKQRESSAGVLVVESAKEKLDKYSKCDQEFLIMVINKLEIDNRLLKDILARQNEELKVHEKSALTKEQTTSLLQELRGLEEKFEEAKKAKGYFKSQWKKAFEEIHELKAEDYKHLQNQIKQNKADISNLSLDNYVVGNSFHIRETIDFHDGFRTNRTSTDTSNIFT